MMCWEASWKADPLAREVANGHYNRQSVESPQFCPPGRTLVLYAQRPGARAFWVTSWPFAEHVRHAWAGAWVCSAFRLEAGARGEASELIVEALAATAWRWPAPPSVFAWKIRRRHDRSEIEPIRVCMVTFVDPRKTAHKRDPGRCFRRAGFVEIGRTKDQDLVALGLPVEALPVGAAPRGAQLELAGCA